MYLSVSIGLALCIASVVIVILARTRASVEDLNNQRRIATWWGIFFVYFAVANTGGWLIELFVYALLVLSIYELAKLQAQSDVKLALILIGTAAACILLYQLLHPPVLFAMVVVLVVLNVVLRLHPIMMLALTSCYVSFGLLSLVGAFKISEAKGLDAGLVLFSVLFLVSLNDVAQYLVGKSLGKRALLPAVSPNKTLEGALGGMAVTSFASCVILPRLFAMNSLQALALGVLIALLACVGDLFISYIKRRNGVKDSGRFLPGHGGLLDRLDSLLLVSPALAWLVLYS